MNKILLVSVATLSIFGASVAHAGPVGPGGGGGVPVCDPEVDDCTPAPIGGSGEGDGGSGTGSGTGSGSGSGSGGVTTSAFTGGGTTLFTTRSAFDAAAPGSITDAFEIATPTSGGIGNVAFPSETYTDANGVTFSVPLRAGNSTVDLNVLDSTYVNGAGTVGAKFNGTDVLTSSYYALTITFPTAITALAFDFGSQGQAFANKSDTFSFTIPGFGTQTLTSPSTGLGFFGLTSSAGFTSITIDSGSNTLRFFDNVSFVPAADAVPEPAMLGLFGLGAIGLGLTRRRRK